MEPRYTCNVYAGTQRRVHRAARLCCHFPGMTCWSGEQIVVQADMPRDVDFNYTGEYYW
jgi:predicted phage tail protein